MTAVPQVIPMLLCGTGARKESLCVIAFALALEQDATVEHRILVVEALAWSGRKDDATGESVAAEGTAINDEGTLAGIIEPTL